MTFPLQNVAAQNAKWVLDLIGVPVFLDGNIIHLSHATLGVTEACSGIRSLISLITLAVVWAHLSFKGVWAKLVLIASALPITIIANSARVIATAIVAQWFGMEYAEGFYHGFAGWLIFLVAFGGLLSVHGLIRLAGMIASRRYSQ
jgi:exosortase